MADETIWHLANDFVVTLEENFYTSDIEFDSDKCDYIFYEIGKMFVEKNKYTLYRIELYKFIRKCFSSIDKDGLNNYSIFYNNLNLFLELDFMDMNDIQNLKARINNRFELNKNNKEIVLSNIS